MSYEYRYNNKDVCKCINTCACGKDFTLKNEFPSTQHNEIRDMSAQLMSRVCHNVSDLQPITGEPSSGASAKTTDCAHLDIAENGFWGSCFEKT